MESIVAIDFFLLQTGVTGFALRVAGLPVTDLFRGFAGNTPQSNLNRLAALRLSSPPTPKSRDFEKCSTREGKCVNQTPSGGLVERGVCTGFCHPQQQTSNIHN